jgi:hypothetical protein
MTKKMFCGKWSLTDYQDHCMLSNGYNPPERYTPAEAELAIPNIDDDDDKVEILTMWLARIEEDE